MTYRGIVKNGSVVLEDQPVLPEGTVVDVTPVKASATSFSEQPAFGMWRDRKDLPQDPGAASLELRSRLGRRTDDE